MGKSKECQEKNPVKLENLKNSRVKKSPVNWIDAKNVRVRNPDIFLNPKDIRVEGQEN